MQKVIYQKIYVARQNGVIKQEHAEEIGKFLENLKDRSTIGILKAVEKNKNHIIYDYIFNNTNEEAITEYRLHRVRQVCQSVMYKLKKNGTTTPIRLLHNIHLDKNQTEYKTVEEVFNNREYTNQVIRRALTELNNWKERYKMYEELSKIVIIIEEYLKKT